MKAGLDLPACKRQGKTSPDDMEYVFLTPRDMGEDKNSDDQVRRLPLAAACACVRGCVRAWSARGWCGYVTCEGAVHAGVGG